MPGHHDAWRLREETARCDWTAKWRSSPARDRGSGIGAAAARLFAQEGARVVALGHTQENTEQVVGEITRSGGEAMALVADVSRPQEMEQTTKRTVERWGRLDVVFANAGVNDVWAPLEELAPEEWNRTIATNLME
jgi:NAD(P)-dependent dehydrogenase (short-subunit alcohol dehydrogenase family)